MPAKKVKFEFYLILFIYGFMWSPIKYYKPNNKSLTDEHSDGLIRVSATILIVELYLFSNYRSLTLSILNVLTVLLPLDFIGLSHVMCSTYILLRTSDSDLYQFKKLFLYYMWFITYLDLIISVSSILFNSLYQNLYIILNWYL